MIIIGFILFIIGIFKQDKRFYKASGAFIVFGILMYVLSFIMINNPTVFGM